MKYIKWNDSRIHYSGRMEKDPACDGVRWAFAATSAYLSFTGTEISVEIDAHSEWWDIYLGVIIDGVQKKIKLHEGRAVYVLARDLGPSIAHELLIFKRMDTANLITVMGFELDDDAHMADAATSTSLLAGEMGLWSGRRIEFFGDSVSCGEVSEAVLYTGREDPAHNGEYSNSWYSYAWMTARKLHAEIHDTSQGGIALMDGSGWYHEPAADGMESFYNKCQPNKNLAPLTDYDMSRWIPQVAVIAIGQNDSHPDDYMKQDYDGERARRWRRCYQDFIERLLSIYPDVHIVCLTTILKHDPSWDRSIEEIVRGMGNDHVHHFLFSNNGCGTPGHIRIPEADAMSDELATFIDRLR